MQELDFDHLENLASGVLAEIEDITFTYDDNNLVIIRPVKPFPCFLNKTRIYKFEVMRASGYHFDYFETIEQAKEYCLKNGYKIIEIVNLID